MGKCVKARYVPPPFQKGSSLAYIGEFTQHANPLCILFSFGAECYENSASCCF